MMQNQRVGSAFKIYLRMFLAIIVPCLFTSDVSAVERKLEPGRGLDVIVGAIHGVAYYTDQRNGFLLVLTVAEEGGTTMRFETLLSLPDQSIHISVPRAAGKPAMIVTFTRTGAGIRVSQVNSDLDQSISQADLLTSKEVGSHAAIYNKP